MNMRIEVNLMAINPSTKWLFGGPLFMGIQSVSNMNFRFSLTTPITGQGPYDCLRVISATLSSFFLSKFYHICH